MRVGSPEKSPFFPQLKPWILVCICGLIATQATARASEGGDGITAVASRANKDYIRVKLPDGSFQPETYAFGEGGNWGGEIKDETIDKLHFLDVAHAIAVPLAAQNYYPATDPAKTKLLIMVYWGTTAVPIPYDEDPLYHNYQNALAEYNLLKAAHQQGEADAVLSSGITQLNLANQIRDRIDFKNAGMIGYDFEGNGLIGTDYGSNLRHSPLGTERNDQTAEIEENRYFVVLMAYDFRLMWKEKKHKLLWETRFSIREANHQFDRDLPAMASYASKYFGQDTHGVVRKAVPLGNVEIGEVKSLGEVDGPKK